MRRASLKVGAPAGMTAPGNLGGFGGDAAIRTPQTLNGPVLTRPAGAVKKAAGAKAAVRKGAGKFTHPSKPEAAPQAAVPAGK